MTVRKLLDKGEHIALLIDIENDREKLIFQSIFYETYKLLALANGDGKHLAPDEPPFTHDEIKEISDKIYVAI